MNREEQIIKKENLKKSARLLYDNLVWSETKEGFIYWRDVFEKIMAYSIGIEINDEEPIISQLFENSECTETKILSLIKDINEVLKKLDEVTKNGKK